MIPAGQIVTVQYLAWNAADNEPELNDAANHAIAIVRDGVEIGASGTPQNLSAGMCSIELTVSESNGNILIVGGISLTSDVYIIPQMIITNKVSLNRALYIGYTAWDKSSNVPKTGDVSNHTLKLSQNGVEVVPTNSPSEVNALSLPGLYLLLTEASENIDRSMSLYGTSSTADINILPMSYSPDPISELKFITRPEVVEADTEIEVIEICLPE
jgi:hypothetical protein